MPLQRLELEKPQTVKTLLLELQLDESKFFVYSHEEQKVMKSDEEVRGKIIVIPKIAGG